ncbi:MAG: bacteriohemerythrin [Treponema sp.]|jgi:hemerythrin|nr:bacteriohemerythrin [Treponema sp.]
MSEKYIPDKDIHSSTIEMIVWGEQYEVNIPLIDSQHKELVELINQLIHACRIGTEVAEATFAKAMHKMVDYVRFHFSAEIELLEKIKYPDCHEHKKQHEKLVSAILSAVKDFNEGKDFVPNHFVRTLKDWVFEHIAVFDKQYALFVADQKRLGLLTDKQLTL